MRVYAFLGCLLRSVCSFSQSSIIVDSLQQVLSGYEKEDSNRVELMYQLGFAYWNNAPLKTDSIGQEVLALSQKIRYKKGEGRAYRLRSIANWH